MDYYIDKFELIVDLLRTTGAYTATNIPTTTTYTVVSDIITGLAVDDYLTLDGVEVRVLSITNTKEFVVEAFDGVITPSGVWKAMAPYSDYGTRKTIDAKLLEKNGGEFAYQKYPLIALRLPAEVTYDEGVGTLDANILFATFTDKDYNPQQRIANVFKPILYPLVDRFFKMVKMSGEFISFNQDHSRLDRLFYGTESGSEENIAHVFTDPLDAVEIRNLELNFLNEDC